MKRNLPPEGPRPEGPHPKEPLETLVRPKEPSPEGPHPEKRHPEAPRSEYPEGGSLHWNHGPNALNRGSRIQIKILIGVAGMLVCEYQLTKNLP